ncbi:hypothetical protein [Parathalassolituus penaei]|uniref:DUF11 domain-containing protein n=1 Tax=Parathalassolituus penaei TaxID=2997323 RepID=A0A9X3IU88_9GAMM|nr:hypothetical protein [Parathalassolituus penaei]MCY0966714.1 hypothetical protein [Parathalassolituus penaei]
MLVFMTPARAGENVVLRDSFAGNISFELGGNSLRDANNECNRINSSSDTISLPTGSTVQAAYLYWAGSGPNPDNQVTFNGTTVNANHLYTESFFYNNVTHNFFGAKADVTSLVSGSGTYTVSGLDTTYVQADCDVAVIFAGWALAVIYQNPSEAQRVVNLYDGFRAFQSSSITINPSNFIVDSNPAAKGGKHAHITWEGDAGNSQDAGGYSERLAFNGNTLTDAGNPNNNQFNSYSNVKGNTSGVDIDEYNIGSYMAAGATSVTTQYSSGQDLVLLTAELISIPNVDTADVQLVSTGYQGVPRGTNTTYTLSVTNNGPKAATSGTQINIPLSDNLTLASYSGTGWSCAVASNNLHCTYSPVIAINGTATPLEINFGTALTTQSGLTLTATVTGVLFDNRDWNNTATLEMAFGYPILSTSVKSVEDINGGMVTAGDTLRYTITLNNTGTASTSTATLTDQIPANISSFSVVSHPAGSILTITPSPAGQYGTGSISLTNITVNAGSNAVLVIDAEIAAGTALNTSITNVATINDGFGTDTTVTSPTVTTDQAYAPSSGNKPLYLQQDQTMTRVVASNSTTTYVTVSNNATSTWTLTPALAKNLLLNISNGIPLQLVVNNSSNSNRNQTITATLKTGATVVATASNSFSVPNRNAASNTITLNMAGSINYLPAGTPLTLEISSSCNGCSSSLRVFPAQSSTAISMLKLSSYSVINIDSLAPYSAAYPGGTVVPFVMEGSNVYLRAVVSDPFGYADITNTTITVIDPNGNYLLNNTAMSPTYSSGAISVFEMATPVQTGTTKGIWKVIFNTREGYENIVTASNTLNIRVTGRPIMSVQKTNVVLNDPINGTNNPKAIPGAEVLYTLNVRNVGEGTIDTNSVTLSDTIPLLTPFFVGNLTNGSPIEFIEGASPSYLTLTFISLDSTTDDVEFSNDNGNSFGYVPTPDADGYDYALTHFRVKPKGTMPEAVNGVTPGFLLRYKVRVP